MIRRRYGSPHRQGSPCFIVCICMIAAMIIAPSIFSLSTGRPALFALALDLDTQTPWLKQRKAEWKQKEDGNNSSSKELLPLSRDDLQQRIMNEVVRHLQIQSSNEGNRIDDFSFLASRKLGDFDELNELLGGVVIALPDMYVNAGLVLGSRLRLWTSNLECTDIRVRNIIVEHNKRDGNKKVDVTIKIQGLGIDCNLDWR